MKKRYYTIAILLAAALHANAQTAVFISLKNGNTAVSELSAIDSLSFSEDAKTFFVSRLGKQTSFSSADIQGISYGELPTKLSIVYNGNTATVINPYYFDGSITATVKGAHVTITNSDTSTEYTTSLTGSTEDGSFTYNGDYKTTIQLAGVNITNPNGAAIDIEDGKRVALELKKGTVNTITDGSNGKQKAALYCKGHLEVDKPGTLNVTGNTAHAISAKEYIQFKNAEGIINILGAEKDAIHCKQYFLSNGYTFNISNIKGDGIQVEKDGEENGDYPDGSLTIQGGKYNIAITADDAAAIQADSTITINTYKSAPEFTINTTGAADKGIKADGNIYINGGTLNITQSGDKIIDTEKGDLSYVTAIKSSYDIIVSGGNITVSNTADGGKGLSADGSITISGDATVIDITANGKGSTCDLTSTGAQEEEEYKPSYIMYFSLPANGSTGGGFPGGGMNNGAWTTLYLYKSDGTLVQQLNSTKTVTATNGTSATFYYYDFKNADNGSYYLQSANYSSSNRPGGSGTTYIIRSSTFSGPTSGTDLFYTVSNSYSTSGTTRTYTVSNVTSIYAGGAVDSEAEGKTYNASCMKADKSITIDGGMLTLKNSGAMSKGIKSSEVILNGGNITATPTGTLLINGNDVTYSSAVKCDNYTGNGGTMTINASGGNAIRGISANKSITIKDGTYNITSSSAGQTATNDTYTAKGIKADQDVNLLGGNITIKMTGTGGKGITAGTTYIQGTEDGHGPILNVSTSGTALSSGTTGNAGGWGGNRQTSGSDAKAIKAEGAVSILGGTTHVNTATDGAEGLESKVSITISGGNHYFKCYDDCINSSGCIYFNGGNTVCYGYGNDAVDSNAGKTGAITIAGGNVFAYTTKGSPEEGLDCDNNAYIVVKGGIAISAGGAQGGGSSSSIGSANQGYYIGNSPSSYGNSYYYTLCNTSGTPIATYKFEASCSNSLSLLTAPNMGTGTATVKYGTVKPSSCQASVTNAAGEEVFFIAPTVSTTGTTASITAK